MQKSPYTDLPPSAFWATSAAQRDPLDVADFYIPRTVLKKSDPLVFAGSCFAQHVSHVLKAHEFNVLDTERLPPAVPKDISAAFGYGHYSARYGNIYTIRQMKQLLLEAFDGFVPDDRVWMRGDRYFDAQRPGIEPDGLSSEELILTHRDYHLARVRDAFRQAKVFFFTFGLTEAWFTADERTVFPTAPGTIAGSYDPDKYTFCIQRSTDVREDFLCVRDILRSFNPDMRFVLTVSPVALTATRSGAHVEVANCRSKSTLRTVCAELYEDFQDVDYFPSYEIITAQTAHGTLYNANLRTVRPRAVDAAVGAFVAAHAQDMQTGAPGGAIEDVACEEMLLEQFAKP